MLQSGFHDAAGVMGEAFTFQNAAYLGIFSPIDEKLTMELGGMLDEADFVLVVSTDQFADATIPETGDILFRGVDQFQVKGIKSDPSALLLALKKTST